MTAVPPLQRESDFDSAFRKYHDPSAPCDTLVYLWLLRRCELLIRHSSPPSEDDTAILLNGYLRHWGGMSRFLGGAPGDSEPDPFRRRVHATLREHWPDIRRAREMTSLTSEARATIKALMDDLTMDFRKRTKKGERHSAVAGGKLLHLLLPNLCVIWDTQYVLNRGLRRLDGPVRWFDRNGKGYVEYLEEKFHQFSTLADGLKVPEARLADRVLSHHTQQLNSVFPDAGVGLGEPLTKLLDEVNYLSESFPEVEH